MFTFVLAFNIVFVVLAKTPLHREKPTPGDFGQIQDVIEWVNIYIMSHDIALEEISRHRIILRKGNLFSEVDNGSYF